MSNKKITDLTELTTPTTDDVFPVVDIATNTTQKVQLGNLPTTPAVTSALASKQATLVSGTNIKTVNGTSVLGSGDINIPLTPPSGVSGAIQFSTGSAFASDASNLFWDDTNDRLGVGTNNPQTAGHFRTSGSTRGVLSIVNANDSTNYGARVQLYNKQSGDPVVDGANGLALIYTDSTATSFLWNYNNGPMLFGTAGVERMRLNNNGGLIIKGSGSTSATTSLLVQNSAGTQTFKVQDDGVVTTPTLLINNTLSFNSADYGSLGLFAAGVWNFNGGGINDTPRINWGGYTSLFPSLKRNGTAIDVRLADDSNYAGFNTGATTIKGSGSTSATTSLLVQNSAGVNLMRIPDSGRVVFGIDIEAGTFFGQVYIPGKLFLKSSGEAVFGDDSLNSSAVLQANSTTKGFLPPRMTTTQKNAIATPASGLVVYDSTTNKLCCYNGSTWNDLF